ncbi:MAG: GNAT family N-acetyltransferase, partial [Candidatus Thiodiazotropha sp. (ex Notomyrtea botanica)]|nr:GNAT family N-acetyltransferase [Candidatus Thiodiazotropha sp. (ex Notomyrtea botanica)]
MNKQTAKGRIRKARPEDIACIHEWLQQQEEAEIDGSFLCNWNLTVGSYRNGELAVFVESPSDKAIAYQWGSLTSPGILEVRADMRGRGVGKRLVEYRIKQARKEGVCILRIQCKPSTSIPFWKKMGFELSGNGASYAYRILEYQLALPQEGEEVN